LGTASALFGGYRLKAGNLLFHSGAFALWAPEFPLPVFRNRDGQRKGFIALFAHELVYGHVKLLFRMGVFGRSCGKK
jgi:hypothetical protein